MLGISKTTGWLLCFSLFLSTPSWALDQATAFSAPQLNEGHYQFNPQKLKKPTLLVFWASWCQSCHYEIPELIELHRSKNSALEIIGITIDRDLNKARRVIEQTAIPYLNIQDHGAKIARQLGVNRTPTLILIDKQGNIRRRTHRLKSLQSTLNQILPST